MSYDTARIGVDPVILTIRGRNLYVYLQEREKGPFKGRHELPGGLVHPEEDADRALKRKLKEIIGSGIFFRQFYTFTAPKRDPRKRTISIAFVALVPRDRVDDMNNWHLVHELPRCAFDHEEIILAAKEYLKENLGPSLMRQFLPKEFPLNDLQAVYEIINEETYDNRNFRKKMLTLVEDTGKKETDVSHRPGKLFRFA